MLKLIGFFRSFSGGKQGIICYTDWVSFMGTSGKGETLFDKHKNVKFYCTNFMRMAWIKSGQVIVLWGIRKQSHLFWR